jgi:hypothetical protein
MKRRFQFIGIHFHHLREQTNATEMRKKKENTQEDQQPNKE